MKYNTPVDRDSANEILTLRITEKLQITQNATTPTFMDGVGGTITKNVSRTIVAELGRSIGKSIGGRTGGTIGAQIFRGLLGAVFSGK